MTTPSTDPLLSTSVPTPPKPTVNPEWTGPAALQKATQGLDLDALHQTSMAEVKSGRKATRPAAVDRLNILEGLKRAEQHPKDWWINHVPVIPAAFRPYVIRGETFLPGDVNELYRELDLITRTHEPVKQLLGQSAATSHLGKEVYPALRALYGHGDPVRKETQVRDVTGFLKKITGSGPKQSWYQQQLMGRTQDFVGRAVIGVDPELGLDEIGVPEDMSWQLFAPHIQRRLVRQGYHPARALEEVQDRTAAADRALDEEIKERPVMYSRAPAWHRFNTIGGWVKRLKDDESQKSKWASALSGQHPIPVEGGTKALLINPFVTTGMNADFDGDCQQALVVVCVPRHFTISAYAMPLSPQAFIIPCRENSQVFCVHLKDFPRRDLLKKKSTPAGPIHLYEVPPNVEVLSWQDSTQSLAWAPVQYWSEHPNRKVEIVTLQSGRQIVTDDHPRAVFGVARDSIELIRATPRAALAGQMMVPRWRYWPNNAEPISTVSLAEFNEPQDLYRLPSSLELNAEAGYFFGVLSAHAITYEDRVVLSRSCPAVRKVIQATIGKWQPQARAYRRPEAGIFYNWAPLIRMAKSLTGLGIVRNRRLFPSFLAAPTEFRKAMLAAILDTKGTIRVWKNIHTPGKVKRRLTPAEAKQPQLISEMRTVSLSLTQEVQLLARSLGITARITASEMKPNLPCWNLSFSTPDLASSGVFEYLKNPLRKEAAEKGPKPNVIGSEALSMESIPWPQSMIELMKKQIVLARGEPLVGDASLQGTLELAEQLGRIPRTKAYWLEDRFPGLLAESPDYPQWIQWVNNTTIVWDAVVEVEVTNRAETGWDLTVPGSETFATMDGLILSNTLALHVPASQEAVDDIQEKLLASKMLFSIKDPEKVMPTLKQEMVLGLYQAHKTPSRQTHFFATPEQAKAAIHAGHVPLSDHVEIGSKPSLTGP